MYVCRNSQATGDEPVVRVSTRQHVNIAHSNYKFARPSEYGEYIRQILVKANIRFREYANTESKSPKVLYEYWYRYGATRS